MIFTVAPVRSFELRLAKQPACIQPYSLACGARLTDLDADSFVVEVTVGGASNNVEEHPAKARHVVSMMSQAIRSL